MTEQNENKVNRIDIISSLQMKNAHHNEKKNEVEDIDDGWSDYDEVDEDDVGGKPSQTQNTNKNDSSSKMIAKAEVYKYPKNYLGNEAAGNSQNKFQGHNSNFHHKKKQGGNFYKEGNRGDRDKKDFSGKPSFVNPHKDNVAMDQPANSDFDSIVNNNTEYSQRSLQTSSQYNNTTKSYNNNYKEHNNNYNSQREHNNNYNSQREHNNNYNSQREHNNNYNNQRNPDYKKHDPKDDVMNTIKNFGKVLSGINEENKNIKDSTRGYIEPTTEKTTYYNRGNNNNNNNRDNNNNYKKNNNGGDSANNFNCEYKPAPKNEFQRPTFVNSSLENKTNNFKELDPSGDPYLKKLQEQVEEPQHYQKRIIKNPNNIKEKEPEIVAEVTEKLEEVQIQVPVHSEKVRFEPSNQNKSNKYGKKHNNNYNANYCSEEEIWNQVVNKNESVHENVKQEETGFYDNAEKKVDAVEDKSYAGNKYENDYNKNKRPSKRNSNVSNVEETKKKIILKDKVVLTTGVNIIS